LTRAQQPRPIPFPAPKAAAPPRTGAKARAGTAFQQHRAFVTQWHRVWPRGCNVQTVWHYLWGIAHRDGRFIYAGAETIAERTGVHERSVKRCVQTLSKHGLVDIERVKNPGRGNALGFRIPWPLPAPPEA
jgi:hypothetical protein